MRLTSRRPSRVFTVLASFTVLSSITTLLYYYNGSVDTVTLQRIQDLSVWSRDVLPVHTAFQSSPDSNWMSSLTSRLALVEDKCAKHSQNSTSKNINNHLEIFCSGGQTPPFLRSLLVDVKKKVFYCAIPKVASSALKAAMMLVSNQSVGDPLTVDVHNPSVLRQFSDITSVAELLRSQWSNYSRLEDLGLESFRKFLVVRHPFERLVSAYVDKFILLNKYTMYFHRRYGRLITQRYRYNGTMTSSNTGHDVTFPEFVQFLTDESLDCVKKFNPHWARYVDLCYPCNIRYDHIIRHDNLGPEMSQVWRELYPGSDVTRVLTKRHVAKNDTRTLVPHYMSQLSSEQIQKLLEVYKDDFRIFGYSWPI